MIGQDLVNGALRALGVIASGESPSTEESTDGLAASNELLASWSALGLTIPQITRDTSVTLNGSESYALATRPIRIKSAALVAVNGTAHPIEIIPAERWVAVVDRTRTGIFAEVLFCDYGYTSATIYLSPKPSAGTLELYVYRPLSSIASLATAISLPPGYERALRLNLAVELASEYGRPVPPELLANAAEAKTAITNLNALVLGEQSAAAAPPVAA